MAAGALHQLVEQRHPLGIGRDHTCVDADGVTRPQFTLEGDVLVHQPEAEAGCGRHPWPKAQGMERMGARIRKTVRIELDVEMATVVTLPGVDVAAMGEERSGMHGPTPTSRRDNTQTDVYALDAHHLNVLYLFS